jgi:hypothetical protein
MTALYAADYNMKRKLNADDVPEVVKDKPQTGDTHAETTFASLGLDYRLVQAVTGHPHDTSWEEHTR